MKRAVFLDRDGTLIEEREYLHKPDQVLILPGAGDALYRLQQAGLKLILVTNQSGVGRGYFTLDDVHRVHQHLTRELKRHHVNLDEIYIAPEAPHQPSRGRKPSPQFLFDARDAFDLDLPQSYMIGDKLIDVQCGWNAGVRKSILVRTGYGAKVEQESAEKLKHAVVVDHLEAAVDWILEDLKSQAVPEKPHSRRSLPRHS